MKFGGNGCLVKDLKENRAEKKQKSRNHWRRKKERNNLGVYPTLMVKGNKKRAKNKKVAGDIESPKSSSAFDHIARYCGPASQPTQVSFLRLNYARLLQLRHFPVLTKLPLDENEKEADSCSHFGKRCRDDML